MRFTPKQEEELKGYMIMPEGKYNFEVVKSTDKTSKSGNEMIELQLKVWDDVGREHFIFDYLLEAMAHKLRHFCEATGLIDKYNLGIITSEDCNLKSGTVEIIIQKGKEKPDGGFYSDKNSVKDYLIKDKRENASNKDEFKDDDVPF